MLGISGNQAGHKYDRKEYGWLSLIVQTQPTAGEMRFHKTSISIRRIDLELVPSVRRVWRTKWWGCRSGLAYEMLQLVYDVPRHK